MGIADIITLIKPDCVAVANLPMSLDSRIQLLRRRRRRGVLRQLLAVAPWLVGIWLVLMVVAGGVVASAR